MPTKQVQHGYKKVYPSISTPKITSVAKTAVFVFFKEKMVFKLGRSFFSSSYLMFGGLSNQALTTKNQLDI
jgi:hypothetical protein